MNNLVTCLDGYKFPNIESGKAENIEVFFDLVIKPQFANKAVIKQQHKALLEYINSQQATFFIRSHGSYKNYFLLRRGFLSKYSNGIEYAFCDNTFAMMFASFKIAGISFTADELIEYFQNRNVICGFATTNPENELAAFQRNNAINSNLNTFGWYLAHVHSVGVGYSNKNFPVERDKFFPIGDRIEWGNVLKTRIINREPSQEEIDLLKAHFIRFTHPLNSFLVPGRNYITYNRGSLIGEEEELIFQVSNFIQSNFQEEFEEMQKIILNEELNPGYQEPISNIIWGRGIPKTKKLKSVSKKHKFKSALIKETIASNKVDGTSNKEINTLDLLRRMGSEAFIYYYLPLKSNRDIEVKKLASFCPNSVKWTEGSKKTRASVAKRIYNEGRVQEALELILKQNLNQNLLKMAQRYYDELMNGQPEIEIIL